MLATPFKYSKTLGSKELVWYILCSKCEHVVKEQGEDPFLPFLQIQRRIERSPFRSSSYLLSYALCCGERFL